MSFWEKRVVAVTGGCGMIPSRLVELLVAEGAEVIVLDNLERGKQENLAKVWKKITFQPGDCTDLAWMRRVLWGVDTVFNLAAKVTSIEFNATHNAEMFFKNMQLQSVPLEAAQQAGVKRFSQCSTVCVYPHNAPIPTPEEASEVNQPEDTNEGYGLAKLMGEKLAQWYHQEYEIAVAITRFANAYDVERDYFDWETSHVIPAMIRKCIEKDEIEVWGDGNQRREFLSAPDAALGILKVARLYPVSEPVNIGTGSNISINELLAIIQDVLGTHKPVKHIFTKPTGHRERLADNSKLQRVCNWVPTNTLASDLERMCEWYLKNRQ